MLWRRHCSCMVMIQTWSYRSFLTLAADASLATLSRYKCGDISVWFQPAGRQQWYSNSSCVTVSFTTSSLVRLSPRAVLGASAQAYKRFRERCGWMKPGQAGLGSNWCHKKTEQKQTLTQDSFLSEVSLIFTKFPENDKRKCKWMRVQSTSVSVSVDGVWG